MEDKWIPSYKPYSTSSSKGITLKVNDVKLTTVKKTVPNIPKNVVTAKLGHHYNNEVQQNQKAHKSVLVAEAFNKNKDKLEETTQKSNVLEKVSNKGLGKSKEIFRAVSPEEFDDVMSTKTFRGIEGKTFAAKEFGNSFDETLNFANKSLNLDKAAILKVEIPQSIYDKLNHMTLDRFIFKSGHLLLNQKC